MSVPKSVLADIQLCEVSRTHHASNLMQHPLCRGENPMKYWAANKDVTPQAAGISNASHTIHHTST